MHAASSFNHVAMPTNDTAATYRFYTEVLGFRLLSAVREEHVPSTGDAAPFLHTFFALADGSCMAFFEVEGERYAGRDDGVPSWIRHFAMNVDSEAELLAWKERLQSHGVEVRGVVDHEGIWQSLYFFDPNGLRLEFTWQSRELTQDDSRHGEDLVRQWIAEHAQQPA
jgi:catechol 2,3-dioxygenase-like lactoylglutathione lyase family enzyme